MSAREGRAEGGSRDALAGDWCAPPELHAHRAVPAVRAAAVRTQAELRRGVEGLSEGEGKGAALMSPAGALEARRVHHNRQHPRDPFALAGVVELRLAVVCHGKGAWRRERLAFVTSGGGSVAQRLRVYSRLLTIGTIPTLARHLGEVCHDWGSCPRG